MDFHANPELDIIYIIGTLDYTYWTRYRIIRVHPSGVFEWSA